MILWGAFSKSPLPYDHPFLKLGVHNSQSNLASQIVAKGTRYSGGLYWELLVTDTITLPNSTNVDPLVAPSSKKGVVKKCRASATLYGFPTFLFD